MISIKEFLVNNQVDVQKLDVHVKDTETISDLTNIESMTPIKYHMYEDKYICGLATGVVEKQAGTYKIHLYFRITADGEVNFDKTLVVTKHDISKVTYITKDNVEFCKNIRNTVFYINNTKYLLLNANNPDYIDYKWIAKIHNSNFRPSNFLLKHYHYTQHANKPTENDIKS